MEKLEIIKLGRYVAFNPSSSEEGEYWGADTITELVWNLRHIHEISGTLIAYEREGTWGFEHLEIFDTTKHPKLLIEMESWD